MRPTDDIRPARTTRHATALPALLLSLLLVVAACSGDDSSDDGAADDSTPPPAAPAGETSTEETDETSAETAEPTSSTAPEPSGSQPSAEVEPIVFNGQGNDLVAYETEPPFESQVVITNAADDPEDGRDINGQICFDPDDPRRFVAGEDTDQDGAGSPGWGIFELEGDRVGELSATQVAKLVPTYQSAEDNAENYGCGFLDDGRVLTTDIGNQAEGEPNGQLIVWFPPFGMDTNSYCKVDVALATGQGIAVTDEHIYVAQARAPGVFRYPISDLPTSATPEGGCDAVDVTGAPLSTSVSSELFFEPGQENGIATPNAVVLGPDGTLFVSSVFNGTISEFDANGEFLRVVLAPPDGETLGAQPFSTGTPLGIGVLDDGTLFYADIGIVIDDDGIGPGSGTGTVRRLTATESAQPETMDEGLAFPDGIGIYVPPGDEQAQS